MSILAWSLSPVGTVEKLHFLCRAFFCMDPRGLGKQCWPRQWQLNAIQHFSLYLPPPWHPNIGEILTQSAFSCKCDCDAAKLRLADWPEVTLPVLYSQSDCELPYAFLQLIRAHAHTQKWWDYRDMGAHPWRLTLVTHCASCGGGVIPNLLLIVCLGNLLDMGNQTFDLVA